MNGASKKILGQVLLQHFDLQLDQACSIGKSRAYKIGFESHEPASLALSSALTSSATHAMTAASIAHKPPLSKSPEQTKTSPTYALRAASAADRDSAVRKTASATSLSTPDEFVRIRKLANELMKRDLEREPPTGGVSRSDATRVANLSMARRRSSEQAEHEEENVHLPQIEGQAPSEYANQQDLDETARRIVAERLERVTFTEEEDKEMLAGKAAGESIHRGNERVKDWERVLKSLENKDKTNKKTGFFPQTMRQRIPTRPSKDNQAANVQSQLGSVDNPITQKHMILGRPSGEQSAEQDAATRETKRGGSVELPRTHEEGTILFF